MTRTAINLYSVRDLDEPMLDVLERVADAGYDGVQFSGGLRGASPEAVREKLDELGLDVSGPHVGLDELEADLDDVYRTYGDVLGCDSVVVPYIGSEGFESREAVEETAEGLTAVADAAGDLGWPLHYHNHDHEFVDVGGAPAIEHLLELTSDVGVELDVGWAEVGGHDPVAFIEAYGDRIDLVHMKDMDVDERAFREIGEGDVDMQACADAARDVGASWLIYEHDQPRDPAASIDAGAEFLNGL